MTGLQLAAGYVLAAAALVVVGWLALVYILSGGPTP